MKSTGVPFGAGGATLIDLIGALRDSGIAFMRLRCTDGRWLVSELTPLDEIPLIIDDAALIVVRCVPWMAVMSVVLDVEVEL